MSKVQRKMAGLGEGGQKKLGSSVHQNHGTASLERHFFCCEYKDQTVHFSTYKTMKLSDYYVLLLLFLQRLGVISVLNMRTDLTT